MLLVILTVVGSFASIFGLVVSLYVLWREVRLQNDVTRLKDEEEEWHDCKKSCPKSKP